MNEMWAIAVGLLAVLLAALEAGFRVGKRARRDEDSAARGQIGAVQGAVLGLLGLLLGFSFAGAAGRFMERQDLITREANAIGTAYLRADVLEEPHSTALRRALSEYTSHRLGATPALRSGLTEETVAKVDQLQARMWRAASDGANARPATMPVVLPAVNEVIDVHSLRVAAGQKHLPALILALLGGSSMLAIGVMGYGSGLSSRRHFLLHAALVGLVWTALWTTIDLDYPRRGILQLNDAPLRALKFDQVTDRAPPTQAP